MIIWFIYFTMGIIALYFGADILINNGKKIACKLSISEIVIGITIVAFGTSLPELLVSFTSNLRGESGIALGNIIGSNIANIGLVLGLTAIFTPLKSDYKKSKFDLLFLLLISGLFLLLCYLGDIIRIHALFFLLLLIFYLWFIIKRRTADHKIQVVNESNLIIIAYIFISLVLLYYGTNYFIKGAIGIAKYFGVNNTVIGLTIVAFGTSAPELSTSLVAIKKKEFDIIIGNIIGSNLFNILAVLGITAFFQKISVNINEIKFSLVFFIILTILMVLTMFYYSKISRKVGFFFFSIYLFFMMGVF